MPPSELISPSNKMGDLLLDDNSAVADWYAGRSVFITGATGYMGKVLVEKLLRSCPNIEKIYMLMRTRPNKDRDLNSRLQIFTESRAFENIRRKDPTIFSKLVVVSGDISKPDLGISREDREVLKSKISVVFHVAATVKFMAPIRESVEINIVGTKAVLALCREVANLAWRIYPSLLLGNILKIVLLLLSCSWLLGSKPNTYVLTKALAESLIQKAKGLPVAIVRPSIVTAAWMEPHPGWVDSNSGIHALVLGGARGVIRTFPGDPKNQADFIPVDIPINMMIVAAWHTARTFSFSPSQYEPTVYNATSGARNPTTWGILEILNETAKKYPVNKGLLMYPVFHFDPNPYLNQWLFLLQHKLPARLADWVAVLQGNKPRPSAMRPQLAQLSKALLCCGDREVYHIKVAARRIVNERQHFHFGQAVDQMSATAMALCNTSAARKISLVPQ
ncbi:unnamed protein product [Cyprideis torosa]|uniref:Fatty acyl-CoA reductase n=1 Tax=Cyprideis torosa TaxID=163714 RepID=A0A7R8WEU3_9CRUS|nr:unnamed protein product [Cyprideis torosa]CAG0889926.1 unnamed protein product [Cyprideis torosa]